MMDTTSYWRRIVRQTIVLTGLAILTFAAGAEWAEAATATAHASHSVPSAPHVIILFLVTIGFLVRAATRPLKPARVKVRRRDSR